MKKTYIQPGINVVVLQHQQHLLSVSGLTTTSDSGDVDLEYDMNGGDQSYAW